MARQSPQLQEHIDMVATHKELFRKAIFEDKYTASDLAALFKQNDLRISLPLLKQALLVHNILI